ncbi:hydroxymethylglutaryl-CoA lyase, partial [Bacillus sp. D-CC]
GLERAFLQNVDEVNVFLSASESHNKSNINKSIKEALVVIEDITKQALFEGKKVRGYVSTVFGCPYEGDISVIAVDELCDQLFSYGIYEVSLHQYSFGPLTYGAYELSHQLQHCPMLRVHMNIDEEKLLRASQFIQSKLNIQLPSHVYRALQITPVLLYLQL